MKHLLLSGICLVIVMAGQPAITQELEAGFQNPPQEARTRAFWWWLSGNVTKEAITRDLEWGIPIPLPGYDTKRIYVWFENVIGYLSASKQWAKDIAGDVDAWRPFWSEGAKGSRKAARPSWKKPAV